jgi:hypothetical protein
MGNLQARLVGRRHGFGYVYNHCVLIEFDLRGGAIVKVGVNVGLAEVRVFDCSLIDAHFLC